MFSTHWVEKGRSIARSQYPALEEKDNDLLSFLFSQDFPLPLFVLPNWVLLTTEFSKNTHAVNLLSKKPHPKPRRPHNQKTPHQNLILKPGIVAVRFATRKELRYQMLYKWRNVSSNQMLRRLRGYSVKPN